MESEISVTFCKPYWVLPTDFTCLNLNINHLGLRVLSTWITYIPLTCYGDYNFNLCKICLLHCYVSLVSY
jgi:hypothetical protein